MTLAALARRSLQFYFRSHLGTIFGAAIATAVLAGALLVGDSVRGSLREMALARLGRVASALASGDRLFRAALAEDLQRQIGSGVRVAPLLQVPGTATRPDGAGRANLVQVNGVDTHFFQLANVPLSGEIADGTVWINERLARQLNAKAGDAIILRVPRISHLSRDAPLAPEEDSTVALRLEIRRVVSDPEFGRFGLAASQVPPFNAFVPLPFLQQRINAINQANVLLATGPEPEELAGALDKVFTLQDAQLLLKPVPGTNVLELRSSRVFLDQPVSAAALQAATNAQPVLTYFVNQLRAGTNRTPYSMVAGAGIMLPPDMRDDEIIINQWLADDLHAGPGDQLALSYFVMGLMRDLVEKTNVFRVRAVAPMQLPWADPTLMPDFPGMTDAANCRDWDTGFPINTDAIRDKDEDYWHKYRGTPKAFVTLKAATAMWQNRFGDLTAVRYPGFTTNDTAALSARILQHLHPRDLGFVFQPVRQQALAASSGAQDFGGLFIGFSFFLIASALILISLLFRFALEQRAGEIGTLLALGFPHRRVRRLLILEALGLSVVGGILGVALAVFYARGMLYGLSTIWSGAVAGATLSYHSSRETLLIGFASGVLVALFTIWWALWRETRRTPREMLAEGFSENTAPAAPRRANWALLAGTTGLLLGLAIAAWGLISKEQASADLFFSAGALVLLAGFFLSSAFIRHLEFSSAGQSLSLAAMGIRSMARRRTRSRAAVGLLACGAFLIASIGAFHLDAGKGANLRSSGTGGFALIGESSIPIVHNLNSRAGRDFYGLSESDLQGVQFVPLRVLPGEDASCLNLNRAQRPRLLGVNPGELARRGAFTFNAVIEGNPASSNAWHLLDRDFGPEIVPAISDAASIQWALGKKVGDTIPFTDGNGRPFQVKIVSAAANSILQGSLLISESQFVRRFPAAAGYRMFLIDAPAERAPAVASALTKSLQDTGMEVTSARERLAAFNSVQNTYLGTFQMLGGLGLLLGSFGLGIILLRNVFERRGELALLLAVGFRKPALRWLVLSEHAALLLLGLFAGVLAAAIAVLPSILSPGSRLPFGQLAATLGAVLICGLVWTIIAAARALRAPLLKSLRNE